MSKILITGAGGFVGQLLAEKLLDEGHDLILADIFEPPNPGKMPIQRDKARCIKVDIYENAEAVLAKDLRAIYVFHGIMSAGSEADFELGYRVNLQSTIRLLEAVRKIVPGVRLIYAASTAGYGQPLPQMPSETTMCTPQGSYGTQKVMIELLLNDYHRRGFIDVFTLRFPTISVRPGKPTQAASSWMSGIIREPLQDKESVLPCDDDFECWILSPRKLLEHLLLVLNLPSDCMPPHIRQVLLPGITVTVREMLQALQNVGGQKALDLVKPERPSAEIKSILDSWPVRFDVTKALNIGFSPDQSFQETVQDFADSLNR